MKRSSEADANICPSLLKLIVLTGQLKQNKQKFNTIQTIEFGYQTGHNITYS